MRKLFLLGTMLGVASAALAFGGVFGGGGHGSKSTTYKGGVDAIGVHFGGEKKTSDSQPEATCDNGTSCGDGCCQMNDVCKQNEPDEYQCCNEELDHCCPVGQGVHRTYIGYWANTCCEGKLYCRRQDANGNCLDDIYCCPPEKTVLGPFEHLDGQKDYLCCNEGEELYVSKKDSNGDSYECCSNITGDEKIHRGAGPNGADICCHSSTQEIFCATYDSNDNCTEAYCYNDTEREVKCAYQFGEHKCTTCNNPDATAYIMAEGTPASCCNGTVYCSAVDGDDNCIRYDCQ